MAVYIFVHLSFYIVHMRIVCHLYCLVVQCLRVMIVEAGKGRGNVRIRETLEKRTDFATKESENHFSQEHYHNKRGNQFGHNAGKPVGVIKEAEAVFKRGDTFLCVVEC